MYLWSYQCTYLYMYIYNYIWIYICIYIYTYKYTHKYIYIYICTNIYMYTHIYLYIHTCKYIHVYMYIHIYIHMYVYIHICNWSCDSIEPRPTYTFHGSWCIYSMPSINLAREKRESFTYGKCGTWLLTYTDSPVGHDSFFRYPFTYETWLIFYAH